MTNCNEQTIKCEAFFWSKLSDGATLTSRLPFDKITSKHNNHTAGGLSCITEYFPLEFRDAMVLVYVEQHHTTNILGTSIL